MKREDYIKHILKINLLENKLLSSHIKGDFNTREKNPFWK